MGNALRDLGQFADAATSYRRALAINNDLAEVYCDLGAVLQCLEQYDDAVAFTRL